MKRRHFLGVAGFSTAWPVLGRAQEERWPQRQLRIVVGFPPGGSSDTIARTLANTLAGGLATAVVVENKPGASAIIAAETVIQSTDQHTVLLHPTGIHALRPHVTTLRFDPWKSLLPLTTVAAVPTLFVTGAGKPFRSLAELVAAAKEAPGRLNMAMAGNATTTHLTSELLRQSAGIDAVAVPFNGAAPALQALLGGDVDVVNVDANTALAQIAAGKLRALAVASRERFPFLPDVPTTAEAGFPDVLGDNVYGIHVPASMPEGARRKLLAAVHQAIEDRALRDALRAVGLVPRASTPEQFVALAREDEARFLPLIRKLGLQMR